MYGKLSGRNPKHLRLEHWSGFSFAGRGCVCRFRGRIACGRGTPPAPDRSFPAATDPLGASGAGQRQGQRQMVSICRQKACGWCLANHLAGHIDSMKTTLSTTVSPKRHGTKEHPVVIGPAEGGGKTRRPQGASPRVWRTPAAAAAGAPPPPPAAAAAPPPDSAPARTHTPSHSEIPAPMG